MQAFINQDYSRYSQQDHHTWGLLFRRMLPLWRQYANPVFLKGMKKLDLNPSRIPRLDELNRRLRPLTGFQAMPVSGYLPSYEFFDCLRKRIFPTTVTIRDRSQLDYLPEPDIFHDVSGHVPMHTDPVFAATLVRFGECAVTAAHEVRDEEALENVLKAMARFFWFTIEFGLVRSPQGIKAYGSGLLSSHGELEHALLSPRVERRPLALTEVLDQSFEIDHYQPVLFVASDLNQVFDLAGQLLVSIRRRQLPRVCAGGPSIDSGDLALFSMRT
jgi:phenylalanine-4-hydroxylase